MRFNVKADKLVQNIAASSHKNAAIKFLINYSVNSKQLAVTELETNVKKIFRIDELNVKRLILSV